MENEERIVYNQIFGVRGASHLKDNTLTVLSGIVQIDDADGTSRELGPGTYYLGKNIRIKVLKVGAEGIMLNVN